MKKDKSARLSTFYSHIQSGFTDKNPKDLQPQASLQLMANSHTGFYQVLKSCMPKAGGGGRGGMGGGGGGGERKSIRGNLGF